MAIVNELTCENCGLELVDDGRLFYYDEKSDETVDYLLLMLTVGQDMGSKIKGTVSETYCRTCKRYVKVYSIREIDGDVENLSKTVRKGIENHMVKYLKEIERLAEIKRREMHSIEWDESYLYVHFDEYEFDYGDYADSGLSKEAIIKDALKRFHNEIDSEIEYKKRQYDKRKNALYLVLDESANDDPSKMVSCPGCGNEIDRYIDGTCPGCGEPLSGFSICYD